MVGSGWSEINRRVPVSYTHLKVYEIRNGEIRRGDNGHRKEEIRLGCRTSVCIARRSHLSQMRLVLGFISTSGLSNAVLIMPSVRSAHHLSNGDAVEKNQVSIVNESNQVT